MEGRGAKGLRTAPCTDITDPIAVFIRLLRIVLSWTIIHRIAYLVIVAIGGHGNDNPLMAAAVFKKKGSFT